MSEAAACQSARFVPTKTNPSGDCGRPASLAVRLGDTGRHLPVCPACSVHYSAPVRLTEIEGAP